MLLTKNKFLLLSDKRQHKHAADILKLALMQDLNYIKSYEELCRWLNMNVPSEIEELHNRYYEHMRLSKTPLCSYKEDLENVSLDALSNVPYLPIIVYFDNLRSAFNVGSILRTMEAFRIKSAYFAGNTPKIDHPKVKETSMSCSFLIEDIKEENLLTKPMIALECTEDATSIYDFIFPDTFTLIVGNEALGISKDLLKTADYIIKIPLVGAKNSLNVSSAFAITAYEIRKQFQKNINMTLQ